MKTFVCLCLCIVSLIQEGQTQLEECTTGSCTGEPNASTCNSDTPSLCVCDANFKPDGPGEDCEARTCSADSDCAPSDTNSYCDTAPPTDVCACKVNYDGANKATCDIIPCSGDGDCPDSEAYCNKGTSPSGDCACKVNYDGSKGSCTLQECSNDYDCTATNSYCNADSTDSINDGCNCGKMTVADSTEACETKPCTDDDKDTECGSSALCVSGKCACPANMISGAAGCIEKTCSTNSHCTEKGGDTNLECKSGKCACKDGYEVSNTTCVEFATTQAATTSATSATSGSATASFSIHLFLLTLGLYRVAKMLE